MIRTAVGRSGQRQAQGDPPTASTRARALVATFLLCLVCAACSFSHVMSEPDAAGFVHDHDGYRISVYPATCGGAATDEFNCFAVTFTPSAGDHGEIPADLAVLWDTSSDVGPDQRASPLLAIPAEVNSHRGVPASLYASSDPGFIAAHLLPLAHGTHRVTLRHVANGAVHVDTFEYRIFRAGGKSGPNCFWMC